MNRHLAFRWGIFFLCVAISMEASHRGWVLNDAGAIDRLCALFSGIAIGGVVWPYRRAQTVGAPRSE